MDKFIEDIRKEFEEKFIAERKDSLQYWDFDAFPDIVWLWVEQKLKDARIDVADKIIKDILLIGEEWKDSGDYLKQYAVEYLAGYLKDKYIVSQLEEGE
jgi:hypothetical protein